MTSRRRSSELPYTNDDLKNACQEHHDVIVKTVNCSPVSDYLFAMKVLSHQDLHTLTSIADKYERCRQLLLVLHMSYNVEAFVHFYAAIEKEEAYRWLARDIVNSCPVDALSAQISHTCLDDMPRSPSTGTLYNKIIVLGLL